MGQVEGEMWVKRWSGGSGKEKIPHVSQDQQSCPGRAHLQDGAIFSIHIPSDMIMVTVDLKAERPTPPECLLAFHLNKTV